ncbi:MAG: DUF2279 domain-containing protein [Candidatus Kapabacteria bacterium]|nr:DUF2279 domain-containing protein [Candidatus Kapabacteria bacterium]
MKTIVVVVLAFNTALRLFAIDSEHEAYGKDTLNWYLLAPVAAAGTGVFVYSQLKQSTVYWGDRTGFYWNFNDDWRYAHGGDKFGHAYFANVLTILTRESLINSGMNQRKAAWWGFAVSMIHQTAIEVQDGFSTGKDGAFVPYLGFSWGDFTANTLGAAFPLAQEYSPFLRNFRYKFSINPSAKFRTGNFYSSVTHDYESKYHWLSINVHDLLPASAQKYWTPFLNLALGHSVKDIVTAPGQYAYLNNGSPYHELWLSLDYNFEALPGTSAWWVSLKRFLNVYKLPAPCVRLLPDVVWYGFRW